MLHDGVSIEHCAVSDQVLFESIHKTQRLTQMIPNPFLGVLFHWLGGLGSASFYVPYRWVKYWSWEIYWLTGGVFSWIVAPWLFAYLRTEDLLGVLAATPPRTLWLCYFFGTLWGLGGLTFGLTMRYLGLSLGTAVALGFTATFGTLAPPAVEGQLIELARTTHGFMILSGVLICLVGIAVVGIAGYRKEHEVPRDRANSSIAEFNFRKGVFVAVFAGVMSACFAFGLAAGQPIRELTLAAGTRDLWQGLPVLIVVLLGGFTTNFLWCLCLIVKNRSARQWLGTGSTPQIRSMPLLRNFLLCALAGLCWYLQFFFYTMGESQMDRFSFSSWTLHMASIIIFGTLWGFALKEWAGLSIRTRATVTLGIAILVVATIVIGFGNYVGLNEQPM